MLLRYNTESAAPDCLQHIAEEHRSQPCAMIEMTVHKLLDGRMDFDASDIRRNVASLLSGIDEVVPSIVPVVAHFAFKGC